MLGLLRRQHAASQMLACKRAYSQSGGIERVGVVGLGLMGHGIVQTAAERGFEVVAFDKEDAFVNAGMGRIQGSLSKIVSKQVAKGNIAKDDASMRVDEVLGRINSTTNVEDLHDCDLVVEAIVEDMKVKDELFSTLNRVVKQGSIFASNTSSLSISKMIPASGRPDRTVGLHFFNPVQIMKLVEVVETETTNPEVYSAVCKFGEDLGKVVVRCKDTPGFVVNRLLVPFMIQGLMMYERGDASLNDIDLALKFGAGHPMGPIELADYVGLDTTLNIVRGWVEDYPNEPAFVIPKCLEDRVAAGKLGRKSGEGFFKWDGDKKVSQ